MEGFSGVASTRADRQARKRRADQKREFMRNRRHLEANGIRNHAFICGVFCVASFLAGFFGLVPSRFAEEATVAATVERLGFLWLGMAWLGAAVWFVASAILSALADVVAELRRGNSQE